VNPTPLTVKVTTTAPSSAFLTPLPTIPGGLVLGLGLLLGIGFVLPRKPLYTVRLLTCLAALAISLFACGGGGGSPGPNSAPFPATPSGTYDLTINASSGGATGSYLVTLVVQ
jgi:hypothetical protein